MENKRSHMDAHDIFWNHDHVRQKIADCYNYRHICDIPKACASLSCDLASRAVDHKKIDIYHSSMGALSV